MRWQNLKFFLGVVVVVALVVAGLKTWYIEVVTVGHDGMAPTLFGGDTVLVWRDNVFDHGSIVLCRHPTDDNRFVIGRVIGRNGTDIALDRGRLRIEGTFPAVDWRGTVSYYDRADHVQVPTRWGIEQLGNDDHMIFTRVGREMRLRPLSDYDGLYLLGDNRTYTGEDSREFGPVSETRCIGRLFMRVGLSPTTPAGIDNTGIQLLD